MATPHLWLPPNRAFRCEYVARQISVKATYNVLVTQAEHDAMARITGDCPGPAPPHQRKAPAAPEPAPAAPAPVQAAVADPCLGGAGAGNGSCAGPRTRHLLAPAPAPAAPAAPHYANFRPPRAATWRRHPRRDEAGYRAGLDGVQKERRRLRKIGQPVSAGMPRTTRAGHPPGPFYVEPRRHPPRASPDPRTAGRACPSSGSATTNSAPCAMLVRYQSTVRGWAGRAAMQRTSSGRA